MAAAKATSYYEASASRGPARPSLQGRVDARVCIVGGGFAGLNTALGLVERGLDGVVLLEAERFGHGASGRNGGFVFGGYSLDGPAMVAQIGANAAHELYGLTTAAMQLIRRRIGRHTIDCDAVEGGALLCNWFDDESILRRRQREMADCFGVDWQFIDRATLRAQHLRSDRYHGALLEPDALHFHPLKYTLGLARVAQAGGALLFENSAVRSLRRQGAGFEIHTDAGVVGAEHVVMAAGGYLSGGLVPALERALLPIATYVMSTEPLGERLGELLPSRAAIYDTRFAFDYYRALPDTRLLWGGRISIRERAPQDIAKFLRADMLRVFPELHDAAVEHAWGGLMSYARHQMPQIGRLQDGPFRGAWYGLGFGGHGVAPTTAAGELLADAISGRAALPAGFGAFGLPRVWGPAGMIAAQAQYSWAELKDRWRERFGHTA
jgi:gamma-glutamylputrescine oxidase